MARFLQIAGLVIGLAALVLQFSISIPASMTAGQSVVPVPIGASSAFISIGPDAFFTNLVCL